MTKFRILRHREMGSTLGTFQNRNPAGADITHYCHLVAVIVDSGGMLYTDPRCFRTVLRTLWERERVGRFGRMALKHVKYHV